MIGEILLEDGVLSSENLQEALDYQKKHGGLIGQVLISLGYISEEKLVAAICRQLQVPYLPLLNYSIDMDVVKKFEEDVCRRHMFIAIDEDEKRIFVAISDPLNSYAIEEIEKQTKNQIQLFVSTTHEIVQMLDLAFSTGKTKG